MRGAKPKPVALRELEGNPGKRPLPNCPRPPSALPKFPKQLSPGARKVWRRIGPKLVDAVGVAAIDEPALAMLCESYASWLDLIELARKDGPVVRVNGQPVPNPYAVRSDREAEKCRKLLAEFGATPSSRCRLQAGPSANPADELADFLSAPDPQPMHLAQ